jgi:hypothetical protein
MFYYFSWKNEFHGWLHELEPTINMYLFHNDDIRTEGREQFPRRVSSSSLIRCLSNTFNYFVVVRRWWCSINYLNPFIILFYFKMKLKFYSSFFFI